MIQSLPTSRNPFPLVISLWLGFLLLLQKMTTNLVALKNTVILLFCKTEVQNQFQWPNIDMAVGLMFEGSGENLLVCLFFFFDLYSQMVTLSLHHSNLLLYISSHPSSVKSPSASILWKHRWLSTCVFYPDNLS